MVSEYEEREAALHCGYTWTEWTALPYHDRTRGVAHFRVRRLVDLQNSEAEAQYIERQRQKADVSAED